jgi:hypothetical protein
MTGFRRLFRSGLFRSGLFISGLGHAGALLVGLVLVAAHSHEAIPPEAMVVDVVTPDEIPRLEGTPSNLPTSGSQVPLKGPVSEAQPPPRPAMQQQHAQKPSEAQHEETKPTAMPQTLKADLASAEAIQELFAQVDPSKSQLDPEQQQREKKEEQPQSEEMLARYAIAGGELGGGINATAVGASKTGYDWTAEFRERVSSCSTAPQDITADDKIGVAIRVFLNLDGTLASAPQALEPIMTDKQRGLMRSAVAALEKCQPYTMLPPDKYKQWKKLDLTVYPIHNLGR